MGLDIEDCGRELGFEEASDDLMPRYFRVVGDRGRRKLKDVSNGCGEPVREVLTRVRGRGEQQCTRRTPSGSPF
jgi:hypothetical protein